MSSFTLRNKRIRCPKEWSFSFVHTHSYRPSSLYSERFPPIIGSSLDELGMVPQLDLRTLFGLDQLENVNPIRAGVAEPPDASSLARERVYHVGHPGVMVVMRVGEKEKSEPLDLAPCGPLEKTFPGRLGGQMAIDQRPFLAGQLE
jgi:hypothetical protein